MAIATKNNLVELLCYCIVINKQIHSNAFKVVERFCENNDMDIKLTQAFDILGDTEDKPNMNNLINSIAQEYTDSELQNYKEWVCLVLTADSNIDMDELELVKLMCRRFGWRFKEIEVTLEEFKNRQLARNREELNTQRESKLTQTLLLKAKKVFTFDKIEEERIQSKIDRIMLNGPMYSRAIQERGKVTEEDIKVALKEIQDTEYSLNEMQKEISRLDSEENDNYENYGNDGVNDVNTDYNNIKKEMSGHFTEEIPKQIEGLQNLLMKKEKASLFFSIAFIGRTKAGKSTLHSLLTNEGEDFIGVGKQRTTRFNRVYEKNLIRIIDTPGLNAVDSDDGGRRDEEIALSIVDEVDVVCYLVTNDNIEENEFKFLQTLRESQKKVIILLNYKKNIEFTLNGTIYPLVDKFISNPLEWRDSKEEQNIQGHLNRINKWVKEYYDEKFVTIIPVHLQSAQLSRDEKFAHVADKLYEGSCFNEFRDELSKLIVKDGVILGSKTVLNDTAMSLYRSIEKPRETQKNLKVLLERIRKEKEGFEKDFQQDKQGLLTNVEGELKNMIRSLNHEAYSFADRNWNKNKSTIQRRWENLLESEFNVLENIQDIYKSQVGLLVQDVSERMQDISNTIDSMIISTDINFVVEDVFDSKKLTRFLGSGLGIASAIVAALSLSNPIGIGLMVIGGGLSLLSGMFKSKATKRRENTESILNMTQESISHIEKQIMETYPKNIEDIVKDIRLKVIDKLDSMISSIEIALEEVTSFNNVTLESCNNIDDSYAKRIIAQAINIDGKQVDITSERKFGNDSNKGFFIYSDLNIPLDKAKSISDTVQHEIIFNNIRREVA